MSDFLKPRLCINFYVACVNSNETSQAVLLHDANYFKVMSKMRIGFARILIDWVPLKVKFKCDIAVISGAYLIL